MLNNLIFTLDSLHDAYGKGISVVDVVEESLNRIEKTGDKGIYLYIANKDQLSKAIHDIGQFDPITKPLWGIPFAVKDNIDVAGMPTTGGCPDYMYQPKEDAFVVSLLKKAGAIVIGKTNLDQFATGLVGMRTPHQIPKNAIDPQFVPGGSSSGSAVSVSQGQVTFSLGTDTAGSGRVPAALNNIVGLKPSLGSLSNRGVLPACRTLDTISIFALTVQDAQSVFQCCAVYDEQEAYSKTFEFNKNRLEASHLKLGVPNLASREFDDQAQEDAFNHALAYWQTAGADIIEIDFEPFYDVAKLLYEGPWVAERYSALSPFISESPDSIHPVTYGIVSSATRFSASDLFNAQYKLQELKRHIEKTLNSVDVICSPSIPGFVTVEQITKDPIGPNSRLGQYTNFVNLLDLCAITVPGKTCNDGLPSSITLIAQSAQDNTIHELAKTYQLEQETTLGATKQTLNSVSVHEEKESIRVAVVGAHMQSFPLNYQLTDKGGKFLFSTKTKPIYQLFHLHHMTPTRPGLVQCKEDGYAIELEIWSLPKSKMGDFLQDVKAPLTIGTVILEDGQEVKGFLCESYAIQEAQEISQFGGWRHFCQNEIQI